MARTATSDDQRPLSRVAALASRQHGAVSRRQILHAGCSDKVLRRLVHEGTLMRVVRGVYRYSVVAADWRQETVALTLALPGAVATGLTAARLYGFELPGTEVHVVCPRATRGPRCASARVHRTRALPASDTTRRQGVPVTSPLRTIRDLAPLVPTETLDAFIGKLIATRVVTMRDLEKLTRQLRGPHARGREAACKLRQSIERAGVTARVESVLELELLLALRRRGLPEPTPQFLVRADRRFVARLDFAWVDRKIGLEFDGLRWHSEPRVFRADRRRQNHLQAAGWTIFRATAADLEDGAQELSRLIRHALDLPMTG